MNSEDLSWLAFDRWQRDSHRARNAIGCVTLNLGADGQPVQIHQTTGHVGEVRNNVVRMQQPGHSSMPLPGAKGVAIYPAGFRGCGIIIAVEDVRYRPTGLKPGEGQLWAVDGADGSGNGGTAWTVIQGLLGKLANIFGVKIAVGKAGQTTNVDMLASTKATVTSPRTEIGNGGTLQAVRLADGSLSTTLFAQ